jgi:hypothetical protein
VISGQHCTDGQGHCWSGLVEGAAATPTGKYSVEIAGATFTEATRPFAKTLGTECGRRNECDKPGDPDVGYVRLPMIEIFVDGAIVEVYFNGEALTRVASGATGTAVRMGGGGGGALVALEAWRMAASVTG